MLGCMDLIGKYGDIARSLSDADVEAQRDGTRGQVVAEFNRLYAMCMNEVGSGEDGTADVRYAELAVRILDRIVKLFQLDRVPRSSPDEEVAPAVETARTLSAVRHQIAALAERTQPVDKPVDNFVSE